MKLTFAWNALIAGARKMWRLSMLEPISISEAAIMASTKERLGVNYAPGYHVQQLLNAETEKLRKENDELKDKLSVQIDCYNALKYLHRNCEVSAGKAIHDV